MGKRDEIVSKIRAKVDEWNAEIDKLEASARQKKAEGAQEYHHRLAQLKDQRDKAFRKLREFRNASDDAWDDLQSGAEQIWQDIKQTYQHTRQSLFK